MRNFYQQIVCIGFFLLGVIFSRPTLTPVPTVYLCPGQDMIYTCHDDLIHFMDWIVEPIIPEDDPIIYTYLDQDMEMLTQRRENVSTSLTYIAIDDGNLVNMTTIARVTPFQLQNGTNITCRTTTGHVQYISHSTLYKTGLPYWKHENITYLPQETYFTAVLQLGDMFGGGGVPIDHYIIGVDNDTKLETTGSIYSINTSYHTTLLVNISAHNCAGYSDFTTLVVHHGQESDTPAATDTTLYYFYNNVNSNVTDSASEASRLPLVYIVVVPVAVVAVISMILVLLVVSSWYNHSQKSCSQEHKGHNSQCVVGTEMTTNNEHRVLQHTKDTPISMDCSYMNVPMGTTKVDSRDQQTMEINKDQQTPYYNELQQKFFTHKNPAYEVHTCGLSLPQAAGTDDAEEHAHNNMENDLFYPESRHSNSFHEYETVTYADQ